MSNFNLYSRGDRIFGWANAILLGLFVLSTLYPFIYVLSVSLSSGAAVTAGRVTLWPVDVTLAAYDRVLSDRMFWVAYGNTFIYTFGGTLMSLLIMIPGAYALSAQTPARPHFLQHRHRFYAVVQRRHDPFLSEHA